ncbi:MAG TPA: GAF domain-containing protein [Terriglobales bacterium]|nr:GAF domain-containing protein [Terriglobales bacterium]
MHPAGAKTAEIPPQTPIPNDRRRCVRHKVHIPAYCSVDSSDTGMVLDLSEILDISEDGMSIQTSSPLKANTNLNLCLDLSETKTYIHTAGQVVWSNPSGRVGIRFPAMPEASLNQLKKWLFVNALTGCDYRVSHPLEPYGYPTQDAHEAPAEVHSEVTANPDYTSVLAGLTAVKREVEAIGPNLDAALQLIAERSLAFLRASGAAIALSHGAEMICLARAGEDAPPLGARLQVGSGFSGECVRSARLLRCDDCESDPRVDQESCRALGIRSIIAIPIQVGDSIVGLLELFSPQPNAFSADDHVILRHLAEAAVIAVDGASRVSAGISASATLPEVVQPESSPETPLRTSPSWIREHLRVLLAAAAVLVLISLFFAVEARMPSRAPVASKSAVQVGQPATKAAAQDLPDSTSLEGLRRLAKQGDPAAQFALGAHYATGEDVQQDYAEAVRWFTMAAERGHVVAQATLGAYYWAGRGAPQDLSKAYFWSILAQAGGDQASKYRVAVLTSRMSRSQVVAAQEDANQWLQRHQGASSKPSPARQ